MEPYFHFLNQIIALSEKAYSELELAYKWLLEEKEKLFDSYPED